MKKIIVAFAIALMAGTGIVNAQAECQDGKALSQRVASVLKNYDSAIDAIPYASQIKEISKYWNTIAGNSSAKTGPRKMYLDNSRQTGVVVGSTKRTFISPPSKHNKLKIKITKQSGKAKTDIFICVHDTNGGSEQRKYHRVENGKDGFSKEFTLNRMKGKMVSVVIKGKSVGNTFGYVMTAKKGE